jgi:hypothetical protein
MKCVAAGQFHSDLQYDLEQQPLCKGARRPFVRVGEADRPGLALIGERA